MFRERLLDHGKRPAALRGQCGSARGKSRLHDQDLPQRKRAATSLSPAIRRAIQHSDESVRVIAKRYGVSPSTVLKWRKRTDVDDLRSAKKARENRFVSEVVLRNIIIFRFQTLLPLDDCYYALRMGCPELSRTTLHRCFQRFGAGSLRAIKKVPTAQELKTMPPGYFNICVDRIGLQGVDVVRFSAFDWVSKAAFGRIKSDFSPISAIEFIQDLAEEYPFVYRVQTTDQSLFVEPIDYSNITMNKSFRSFPQVCRMLNIEHQLLRCSSESLKYLSAYPVDSDYPRGVEGLREDMNAFYEMYNNYCKLKAIGGVSPKKYLKDLGAIPAQIDHPQ